MPAVTTLQIDNTPDGTSSLRRLEHALAAYPARAIACSGGIDSLLLATVAHRAAPDTTTVVHTVTPAVPAEATARVVGYAHREHWALELVRSAEFDDERYLANPTERCYFCKTNLYDAIDEILAGASDTPAIVVLSGANTDDLGEYRPGLTAAEEHRVAHPYVAAGLAKRDIRSIARVLGLAEAELPASPCLASRLYTGTRVTAERLRAVELGEAAIRRLTGVDVSRCRIRGEEVVVEVGAADRDAITEGVLAAVGTAMRTVAPQLGPVHLDAEPYRPGRAILQVT